MLRAVPEGAGRDAAIEFPAQGTIAVAMGPIAVPVMILSAMLVSVAVLVAMLSVLVVVIVAVPFAFALVANFHEEFARARLLGPRRRVRCGSRNAEQRQDENRQNYSLHSGTPLFAFRARIVPQPSRCRNRSGPPPKPLRER